MRKKKAIPSETQKVGGNRESIVPAKTIVCPDTQVVLDAIRGETSHRNIKPNSHIPATIVVKSDTKVLLDAIRGEMPTMGGIRVPHVGQIHWMNIKIPGRNLRHYCVRVKTTKWRLIIRGTKNQSKILK